MGEQTCKDCGGDGGRLKFGGLFVCLTCDGTGTIHRTGPYRLADGTWSDGIDRSLELARRDTSHNRWEVWQDGWGHWMAYRFNGKTANYECAEFDTHAEAIRYADHHARTTKNGASRGKEKA